MKSKSVRMSDKVGRPPGSVIFVGEKKTDEVSINIIDYDESELRKLEVKTVEECFPFKDTPTITWININGLHDIDLIQKLGDHFGIHPLVLEDIVNTSQRPKLEESEHYLFMILKMLNFDSSNNNLLIEQISLIVGENYVITFQEREGDVFNHVRERIQATGKRIRFLKSDYLAYALVDAVVDNYFVVLEDLGERVEESEHDLINNPVTEDLESIFLLKRQLIFLRKSIWPLRELVSGLERYEGKLIQKKTRIYLRDLYEHTIQVIDTVESLRDLVSGLVDIYLSSISNKMNQVMKVLTLIGTIFIPLSFLAGVYGMNFDTSISPFNMPELAFKYGYIIFWAIVLVVGLSLVFYFRKKRWL